MTQPTPKPKVSWRHTDPPSLKEAQTFVGGHIEIVTLPSGNQMVVNEEGLLKNLPINEEASKLAGKPIVGDVLVLTNTARLT